MRESFARLNQGTGIYENPSPQRPSYQGYIRTRDQQNPGFYERRKEIRGLQFATIFEPLVRDIESGISGTSLKVLDVGCGDGVALKALTRINLGNNNKMELYGLDIDRETLGDFDDSIQLIQGTATSLPFPTDSFHLAISTQTLEHLDYDEMKVSLFEVKRILHPGGVFYIETPNPESLQAKFMKGEWPMCLPEHLVFIPPTSLMRLLHEVGFTNVNVKTRMEVDQQVNELWEIVQRIKILKLAPIPWRIKLGLIGLIVSSIDCGSITVGIARK